MSGVANKSGRSPSGRAVAASPSSPQAVSPVPASIPSAAELLLYELYDAADDGAFATACDGRGRRKLAWKLDELGLARWCGTSWGSSFFAITDEGKAFIDRGVQELRQRLDAQANEARRAETQGGSVHESAVAESHAPQGGNS